MDGLRALAALPDPIGATTMTHEITPGLKMYRVTCPDRGGGRDLREPPGRAGADRVARRSRAATPRLLKGGREAVRTNRRPACRASGRRLAAAGLPGRIARSLLDSREDVGAMLKEDALIDLIIPRGSNGVRPLDHGQQPHSRAGALRRHLPRVRGPITPTWRWRCRSPWTAKRRMWQSATPCETLLVHRDIAADFLPQAPCAAMTGKARAASLGDEATRAIIPVEARRRKRTGDTEYLDLMCCPSASWIQPGSRDCPHQPLRQPPHGLHRHLAMTRRRRHS